MTAPDLAIPAAVRLFETGRPNASSGAAEDAYSATRSGARIAAVLQAITNAVSVLQRVFLVGSAPAGAKLAWEA